MPLGSQLILSSETPCPCGQSCLIFILLFFLNFKKRILSARESAMRFLFFHIAKILFCAVGWARFSFLLLPLTARACTAMTPNTVNTACTKLLLRASLPISIMCWRPSWLLPTAWPFHYAPNGLAMTRKTDSINRIVSTTLSSAWPSNLRSHFPGFPSVLPQMVYILTNISLPSASRTAGTLS